MEMFKPHALALMKKNRANFDEIAEFCRSPKAFLKYLDSSGIDRAVLINYVAPEVIGFIIRSQSIHCGLYSRKPSASALMRKFAPLEHTTNVMADVEQLLRLNTFA